jgi:dihydropteroate synthase-like protein
VKVLLVTGQLAEESVRHYAQMSTVKTTTISLPTAVAAFLTPQTIADALKPKKLTTYNLILIPGLTRGDTATITKATGVAAFKGPRFAADLPTVLDSLCEIQLSTKEPADDLLREKLQRQALQEIEKTEKNRAELLKKLGNILIGNLPVGKDFPMRILAEIVDAACMDKATIQRTAKRFVAAGADLIDVGMVVGESQPEKAKLMVEWVRQVVDVPVSIDTLDPAEIKAAIEAGAELVLSGDAGNIEEIAPYAKNVVVVVIPTNQRKGYFPKSAHDRVEFLEQIISKAKRLGITCCLADLILEPTNILESFIAFKEFIERNPDVPLFVGVSNVTELMDADSVGVNAVLARLSQEVNASILLATEKSDKARGTVAEEVAAAKMMFLAKKRNSVPKDLGIDLLILKDKRFHEETYNKNLESKAKIIHANENQNPATLDSAGCLKVMIDRDGGKIVALHYLPSDPSNPLNVIKGKTAESIYAKIVELGLISQLNHATYLGTELAKAEVALRTGKGFTQDMPLW